MIHAPPPAGDLLTALAAPPAPARLLGVLPLVVLLIGSGAGGDPYAFLLDSAPGTGCLFSGLALAWAGNVWIERIADRIVRS
jgi:tight adherence protein B